MCAFYDGLFVVSFATFYVLILIRSVKLISAMPKSTHLYSDVHMFIVHCTYKTIHTRTSLIDNTKIRINKNSCVAILNCQKHFMLITDNSTHWIWILSGAVVKNSVVTAGTFERTAFFPSHIFIISSKHLSYRCKFFFLYLLKAFLPSRSSTDLIISSCRPSHFL